jgi:hypothetical protein
MGRMLRVTVYGCVSHHVVIAIHKAVRPPTHTLSLRARRAWQSSLRRYAGCRGDAGDAGCVRWIAVSALLPPRKDNGGKHRKSLALLGITPIQ